MSDGLTHLDAGGAASMVDVGNKAHTQREATAIGHIKMATETLAAIRAGNLKKGDVIGTARLAGIMAAKKTALKISGSNSSISSRKSASRT